MSMVDELGGQTLERAVRAPETPAQSLGYRIHKRLASSERLVAVRPNVLHIEVDAGWAQLSQAIVTGWLRDADEARAQTMIVDAKDVRCRTARTKVFCVRNILYRQACRLDTFRYTLNNWDRRGELRTGSSALVGYVGGAGQGRQVGACSAESARGMVVK